MKNCSGEAVLQLGMPWKEKGFEVGLGKGNYVLLPITWRRELVFLGFNVTPWLCVASRAYWSCCSCGFDPGSSWLDSVADGNAW